MKTVSMSCFIGNLQEVFGEAIQRVVARHQGALYEDCALYMPPGIFVGHDALRQIRRNLRADRTRISFIRRTAYPGLHDAGRLAWLRRV